MSLSKFFAKLRRIFAPAGGGADEATTKPEGGITEPRDGATSGDAAPGGIGGELTDEFDSALDSVFGDSAAPAGSGAVAGSNEHDTVQNTELFAGIAAHHARPVKDFMFELEAGSAPKEWIEVCRPILSTLGDAAESMELRQIVQLVHALDKELKEAQEDEGPWPSKSWNDRILFIYGKLVELQPEAFTVDESDRRRESIIIHSLLRQVPDVGLVSLNKLYRVGLTSRETLFQAAPRDLVSTAGIPEELSQLICNAVQEYRERSDGLSPEELLERGKARLGELVEKLRRHHEGFNKACNAVDTSGLLTEKKRISRVKRRDCALEIDLLLAEMGEVALARELQAVPFGKRLEKLDFFLASPGGATAAAAAVTEAATTSTTDDEDQTKAPTTVGT